MTRPRVMRRIRVWGAALLLGGLLAWPGSAQAQLGPEAALRAAMETETIEGDLTGAIEQYRIIAEGSDRTVAARALIRMAGCHEKLGSAAAREIYERVLSDYADQREQVVTAQAKLAALDVEPSVPPTLTVRELIRSGEGERSNGSGGNDVTGDGQVFIYTEWLTGDLATTNIATGEVRRLFGSGWDGDEWFEEPVLSPDEEQVVFVRYPNRHDAGTTRIEVGSLDGKNREPVYVFDETVNAFTYDWSPDGKQVLFGAQSADWSAFLATLDLEGRSLRRLVTLDRQPPQRAQYSPDGRFIAYDSTKGGDSKIYLISTDGAQEQVLVDSSGADDQPLWTRDGRFLLFRSDRSGQWDLYALRIQEGEPAGRAVIVTSLGDATTLSGTSNDGQLFYSALVDGKDIAIRERIERRVDTAPVSILPKARAAEIRNPSFAPDGKRLAYLEGRRPDMNVRVADLEGKVLQEISLGRGFGAFDPPQFSPDGERLAFRVYDSGEPKIMLISLDAGTVLKVFSPYENGYARVLGWTRDGRYLHALVSHDFGGRTTLDLLDVETEQVVDSEELSQDVRRVKMSPSREYLAMVRGGLPGAGPDVINQLVLRSLQDGTERSLLEGPISEAVWDADSRHLFYYKAEAGRCCSLYSFSLDTEEEEALVDDMQGFYLVAVSPDGKHWALQNRDNDRDQRMMVLEHFLPEVERQTNAR